MSHLSSSAIRDVLDPGWRERDADTKRAFEDFFAGLPARYPRQGIAAVQIVTRSGAQRVEPVIVVDFYREHGDANA